MATYLARPIQGSQADLGEGTLWDERKQTLLYLDVLKNTVIEYNPSNRSVERHLLPSLVSYIGKRRSGGYVVALGDRLAYLDKLFRIEREFPLAINPKEARTNDGNVDHLGQVWIGLADQVKGARKGSLNRIEKDLSTSIQRSQISISNGIDWSLDKQTMFYIDSLSRRIDRFKFDPKTGSMLYELSSIDVSNVNGLPDGMCTDSLGNLWVAFWGKGEVRNYTPEGKLLNTVEVPTSLTTCCTFGGMDLDTLYITSANCSHDTQFTFGEKYQGMLFEVKLPVLGKLDNYYLG
jgi:sugar lactone lactonase YvrE